MAGYCDPPNRFSSTNQPKSGRGRPKGSVSLVAILKKFLERKIKFEDPETQKIIQGRVKDAVVWRLLLNACHGENEAIKEILNRIDGKLTETLIDQSQDNRKTFVYLDSKAIKEKNADRNNRIKTELSSEQV